MRPARPLAWAAMAALLLPCPSGAQERPPLTFEAEAQIVSITAVIHDKAGRPVRGLTEKDVVVLEDGVAQDLTYFREADGEGVRIPLSVVLVLDASGSMKRSLHFLQEAANVFVGKLEEGDRALVVDFNNGVRSSAEFTDDIERLESFIDGLQAWGGTSLNDAVHFALNRVRDQPGRKAVVVFSDGADTTSSLPDKEVVEYARAVEATVYSVGFQGDGPGGSARGFLKRVADETGGRSFFPGKAGDLVDVFRAISAELTSHYAFAYSPKRAPDGSWRRLEVRLDPPRSGLEIRVRKGYFAVQRPKSRPGRGRG